MVGKLFIMGARKQRKGEHSLQGHVSSGLPHVGPPSAFHPLPIMPSYYRSIKFNPLGQSPEDLGVSGKPVTDTGTGVPHEPPIR